MSSAQPGSPLHFRTIETVAELIKRHDVSPVDLVVAALERVERLDPKLRAFITTTPERALRAARSAEAEILDGHYRGPLHGIPIAHKDVFRTRGVRTTGGSRVLADLVPERDAAVVRLLSAAGAVSLGKTNTYEFGNGDTRFYGTPVNPWDPSKVTGGSSAGSASATAMGLCFAASGTDGGGSLRVPAALCNVVGLKPSRGLISSAGVLPYAKSLTVAGPMARTARDCWLLLHAMSGSEMRGRRPDERRSKVPPFADESESRPLEDLRIGVVSSDAPRSTPEVAELFKRALVSLADLGTHIIEVGLPFDLGLADAAHIAIERTEALAAHHRWLVSCPTDYAPITRQRLLLGACVTHHDLRVALLERRRIARALKALLTDVDLIATPTVPTTAWPVGTTRPESTIFTKPANLAGVPAISIPCGRTSAGLPVGIQLIGRMFDEALMLRTAAAYETVRPWPLAFPDDGLLLLQGRRVEAGPQPHPHAAAQPVEREVRRALISAGLPCRDEDIEPIAAALSLMRSALHTMDAT